MVEEMYPWNLFTAILEIDTDWIKGRYSEDYKAGLTFAISTLGVVEQEVIKLRYRESKSYEEIQDIFQCLPEKVKEKEMRALNRLREPELYHYIKYGIAGYMKKILGEEKQKAYDRGYQKGYEDAIADALNGFARPEQELSIMALLLEVLKLDTRSYNCLYYNGCRSVGDCVRMGELHISRIRNLGKKSVDAIARALRQKDIKSRSFDDSSMTQMGNKIKHICRWIGIWFDI